MVDKKLSEFSQITPSEIAKLICLFLDENNAIKNGVVDFATLDALLLHKAGTETITGNKTFSGDAVFEGTTTFNRGINGTVARATADASGNNIANTYATKTELDQKSSFKLFHHDWFDYQLNDQSWLRADTFSWQDGTVYTNAYNHLVTDYQGGTSQTETVGSYTITYVLAADGHKITTDETNVANIYNESGVAWYYILDTTNQRFKLPRENPAREELIQVIRAKGNGKTLGLTDGTKYTGLLQTGDGGYPISATTNLYDKVVGTPFGSSGPLTPGLGIGVTTDSTKSGIVADMTDSTSVYKGKQHLYFYVGQFSQSATEQTAGLNSELFNGKADIEALNNKIQLVSTAPATPTSGVLYVIPE